MTSVTAPLLAFLLAMIVWGLWVLVFQVRNIYILMLSIKEEIEEKMLCEKH